MYLNIFTNIFIFLLFFLYPKFYTQFLQACYIIYVYTCVKMSLKPSHTLEMLQSEFFFIDHEFIYLLNVNTSPGFAIILIKVT